MKRKLVISLALLIGTGCAPIQSKPVETRDVRTTDVKGAPSLTDEKVQALTPQKVEVSVDEEHVVTANAKQSPWAASAGHASSKDDVDPTTILGTIAGLIINPADKDLWSLVGQQAWSIVDKNKPVLNYQDKSVSVLPAGLTNWSEMESWQVRAVTFHLDIKNLLQATPIHQAYTIKFYYGGSLNGKGRYLANVSVAPNVDVMLGYSLSTAVEFSRVVNVGTKENPIPGIELRIGWNVKTILKEARETDSFFIQGDGNIKHLTE